MSHCGRSRSAVATVAYAGVVANITGNPAMSVPLFRNARRPADRRALPGTLRRRDDPVPARRPARGGPPVAPGDLGCRGHGVWSAARTLPTVGRVIRAVEVLAALSLTTDLASGAAVREGPADLRGGDGVRDAAGRAGAGTRGRSSTRPCCARSAAPRTPRRTRRCSGTTRRSRRRSSGSTPVTRRCSRAQLRPLRGVEPDRRRELAATFERVAGTVGPHAARSGCEVSRALGTRLGLPAAVLDALDDVYERWDGLGIPAGRRGRGRSRPGRADRARRRAGGARGRRRVDRETGGGRRGGGGGRGVPPGRRPPRPRSRRRRSSRDVDELLAVLDAPDLLAAVVAAEPGPGARVDAGRAGAVVPGAGGRRRPQGHLPAGTLAARRRASPTRRRLAAGVGDRERRDLRVRRAAARPGPGRPCRARCGTGPARSARPTASGSGCTPTGPTGVLRRCPGLAPLAETAAGAPRAVRRQRLPPRRPRRASCHCPAPSAGRRRRVRGRAREARPHRPAHDHRRRPAGARRRGRRRAARRGSACARSLDGAGLPALPRRWPSGPHRPRGRGAPARRTRARPTGSSPASSGSPSAPSATTWRTSTTRPADAPAPAPRSSPSSTGWCRTSRRSGDPGRARWVVRPMRPGGAGVTVPPAGPDPATARRRGSGRRPPALEETT